MAYDEEEKKQYMVIKIKKPHHAERLGWLALVALLLTIVLYQWIIWPEASECPESHDTETPIEKATELTEPIVETPVEEKKEKVEEKKEELKKVVTEALSGKIDFEIMNVNVAKTKSGLGKITSITYRITNQKADFIPLVRFYLLDSQWKEDGYTPDFLARCCEDKPLFDLPLKAGAPRVEHTFTINFPSLTNLDETKKVIMNLYDKTDTTKLLASGEYVLTKSNWG